MPTTSEDRERLIFRRGLAVNFIVCAIVLLILVIVGETVIAQAYRRAGSRMLAARKLDDARAGLLEKTAALFEEFDQKFTQLAAPRNIEGVKGILEEMDVQDAIVIACDIDKRPIHISNFNAYQMLEQREINKHLGAHLFRNEKSFEVDNYEQFLAGEPVVPTLLSCRVIKEPACVVAFGKRQHDILDWLRGAQRPDLLQIAKTISKHVAAVSACILLALLFLYLRVRRSVVFIPGAPKTKPDRQRAKSAETPDQLAEELARESAARQRLLFERDELRSDLENKLRERMAQSEAQWKQEAAAWRAATLERIASGLCERFRLAPDSEYAAEIVQLLEELDDTPTPIPLEARPVQLQAWLENVLDGEAESLGRKLVHHFQADGTVQLDPEKMAACISELLRNADSAIAGRDVPIRIETTREDGNFEIRIVDRGEGIPDDCAQEAYQPLFSLREGHLGVGLGRARRIAQAHGGGLVLHTEPGKGTVAILRIPATA